MIYGQAIDAAVYVYVLCVCSFCIPETSGKCSRLPSGNCWVNCMEDIFDIICNAVTSEMIRTDISVYTDTTQQLRLYVRASPLITRLSADIFKSVARQILVVDVQELTSLDAFPEIYELVNLRRLSVWNSPKLTYLALELIPPNMYRLGLNLVGITHWGNDFTAVPSLPKLTQFPLRNCTVQGWQPDFLKVFPNLELFEISNSTIEMEDWQDDMVQVNTLTSLKLHNNQLPAGSFEKSQHFLESLLASLHVLPNSTVDISMSNLTINDRENDWLGAYQFAKRLNVRGNRVIPGSKTFSGKADAFPFLKELDMGRTHLLPAQGMFGGFPSLQSLKLDHNDLRRMSEVDMFEGSTTTNLTNLDLSYAELEWLPSGNSLAWIASQVTTLNLEGNKLKVFLSSSSAPPFEKQDTILSAFSNLQKLTLSHNNFSEFHGFHLANVSRLKYLDIRCNPIRTLRKDVFTGLPVSLVDLDVSMCIQTPKPAPKVEPDAFTTLPPVKILRLRSSAYKKWIFEAMKFSKEATLSLRELYVDDNDIMLLKRDTIPQLPNLKTLSLSRNKLQSLAPGIFASLPNLTRLDLHKNRLSSLDSDEFSNGHTQLQLLESLDMSSNGIYQIARGAFDGLPKLRSLMLGDNPTEVQDVFGDDGGQALEYYGIQGYNQSCLRAEFFQKLPRLHWILPNHFNLVLVEPDERLRIRDEYLQSVLEVCAVGPVTSDHETYPGLGQFVSVTIHDTDEGTGLQFPMIAGFLPLSYCPMVDYTVFAKIVNDINALTGQKSATTQVVLKNLMLLFESIVETHAAMSSELATVKKDLDAAITKIFVMEKALATTPDTTIDDHNNSVKADLEQLGIRIRFVAIKERTSDDKCGITYASIGTYVEQEEAPAGQLTLRADVTGLDKMRDCVDYPDSKFADLRCFNVFRKPRNVIGGSVAIVCRRTLRGYRRKDLEPSRLDPVSPPGPKCDHVAIKLQSGVRPRQLKRTVKHRWIFNQEQSDAFRLSLSSVDWFLQLNGKFPTDQTTILEDIVTTTTTLFHKGSSDITTCASFGPIALLAPIFKCAKDFFSSVLREHLEKNRLITDEQFRFRARHSTELLLTITIQQWMDAVDARRSQVTVVDGVQSAPIDVTSGIPQGSILGPLLYICLVKAMRSSLSAGTKLALFVDDSCPSRIFRSPSDTLGLQDNLDSLGRWTQQRKLSFNPKKIVHIRLSRKPNRSTIPTYYLNGVNIPQAESTKYLGVHIDQSLFWNIHTRLSYTASFELLCGCYKSRKKLLIDSLEGRVKRFLRTLNLSGIPDASSDERYCHRLRQLEWQPLFLRRLKQSSMLAYKLIFNNIPLDELLFQPYVFPVTAVTAVSVVLLVIRRTVATGVAKYAPHVLQTMRSNFPPFRKEGQ
ncbi:hypothetical protein BV898_06445 [Hypsibius exemplaris]|uniref:Reverse transcriptase domain-containing protein n=1 Tax=Hypsibius exemplaris TaxID=2072580 RepID=A0A1W0WW71_HYPEX|nr:hypothetical protein BV898_06445 [Hypsibius exemplaris]